VLYTQLIGSWCVRVGIDAFVFGVLVLSGTVVLLVARSLPTRKVRPTLELLSHLRHRNVARILHLCGPHHAHAHTHATLAADAAGGGADEEDGGLAAWAEKRGFDFTFAQVKGPRRLRMVQCVTRFVRSDWCTRPGSHARARSLVPAFSNPPSLHPPLIPFPPSLLPSLHFLPFLASLPKAMATGVPLNHKQPPPKAATLAETSIASVDLAIELAEALVSLHESPIGTVVHGDLKVTTAHSGLFLLVIKGDLKVLFTRT